MEKLREENTGCLFAYSVEVDEAEAAGKVTQIEKEPVHKRIVQEMIRCIEVAGDFEDNHLHAAASGKGRRTWVAIKLVRPISYRVSIFPPANETNRQPYSQMHTHFIVCRDISLRPGHNLLSTLPFLDVPTTLI